MVHRRFCKTQAAWFDGSSSKIIDKLSPVWQNLIENGFFVTEEVVQETTINQEAKRLHAAAEPMNHHDPDSENHAIQQDSKDELRIDATVLDAELENCHQAIRFLEQVRMDNIDSRNRETDTTFETDDDANWNNDPSTTDAGSQKRIGRFEIERLIGRGGFAEVFLAHDPILHRDVAIKVPNPHALVSPNARERFEREARAAALLSHPSIVPVFESGNVGVISYIAYEFCPGQTLARWFQGQSKKVAPRTAATIVKCLTDAVHHAHQRGIIHRDLKPGNILVKNSDSDDDESPNLFITDFGLARNELNLDDPLTVEGAVIGTPAYMSPEQARGETNIGAASDVYSLGIILYELLTGKRPFEGKSHLETLRLVDSALPKEPRRLNPAVPVDLQAICMKAIARNESDRYASAFALTTDLENFLTGRPVGVRKINSFQRLSRWAKRNPSFAFSSAIAILSLVLGLGATLWQWRIAQNNLHEVAVQNARAENHIRTLQGNIDFVLEKYDQQIQKGETLRPHQLAILQQMLEAQQSLLLDQSATPDVTVEKLDNYLRVCVICRLLSEYDLLEQFARTGIRLVDSATDEHPNYGLLLRKKFGLLFKILVCQMDRKDTDVCHDLFDELKTVLENPKADLTSREAFNYHRHLGLTYLMEKRWDEASDAFIEATTHLVAHGIEYPNDQSVASSLMRSNLDAAITMKRSGAKDTSIKQYQKVLESFESLSEEQQEQWLFASCAANAYADLGQMDVKTERYRDALDHFSKAREILEYFRDQDEPFSRNPLLSLLNQIAKAQFKMDDLDQALETCETGLKLAKTASNPTTANIKIQILTLRGRVQFELGFPEDGEKSIQLAILLANETLQLHPKRDGIPNLLQRAEKLLNELKTENDLR